MVLALIVGAAGAILWDARVPQDLHPVPTGRPAHGGSSATIAGAAPASWDPAAIGDAGSAGLLSQVFESLTALDAQNHVQPALARSWTVNGGGTSITFTLRPGISFSDGSPITAADVRRSWLHVLDPAHPSPLAGLLSDVVGASAYQSGAGPAGDVGIEATANTVTVQFRRPAAYFVSTVSSPTLAIVPPLPPGPIGAALPAGLVVSGAYQPQSESASAIQLTANSHYWAGLPAIHNITVALTLDGASPVDAFQAGQIDYVPISVEDASWVRYDTQLGAQLRTTNDLSVEYYGFTTTEPPFDNVDVRRAFAMAVNWDRIVLLDDPTATPATSLVPLGIQGRGTADYSPHYDVAAAKAELAKAGYPDGAGFPTVTLASSGGSDEQAVADELEQSLGVTVQVELMPFGDFSTRLDDGPPGMWVLDWVADYPHPQDFLGLLLGSGSANNVGVWRNSDFDAALDRAASTADAAAQEGAYGDAQQIVADQVPVVPLRYGEDWALSRDGLLGAQETGEGFMRFAGLAWAKR